MPILKFCHLVKTELFTNNRILDSVKLTGLTEDNYKM